MSPRASVRRRDLRASHVCCTRIVEYVESAVRAALFFAPNDSGLTNLFKIVERQEMSYGGTACT